MRVLIIGGTGFIGPFVVRHLHAAGHGLALFHRGRTEADLPNGIAHIHGDRAQIADFAGDFARFGPDVVLDMCPLTERDAALTLAVARPLARRVVAISSADVYRAWGRLLGTEPGQPEPLPLTEDAPLRERLYPYRGPQPRAEDDPQRVMDDYDKIPIERAVLGDPAVPGTVLRLPMVYGPGDGQHRLFPHLKRMDDRRHAILVDSALVDPPWRWTVGYVENVAAAIALATTDERAAGQIYNVGEVDPLDTVSWLRTVGAAAGWEGEIVVAPHDRLPESLAVGFQAVQSLVTDSTRIRRELGYREVVPREEWLRRTIAWERANTPAKIDPAGFDYAAEDAVLAELAG